MPTVSCRLVASRHGKKFHSSAASARSARFWLRNSSTSPPTATPADQCDVSERMATSSISACRLMKVSVGPESGVKLRLRYS